MQKVIFSVIGSALAACLFGVVPCAHASVFSTFSLNEGVSYYLNSSGTNGGAVPVTDTVLPFQTTATINSGNGGTVTTTYTAYDTGTVGFLSINSSLVVTALGNAVGEGSDGLSYPQSSGFFFSQPVSYSITFSSTSGVGDFLLYTPALQYVVGQNQINPNTNYQFSGVLAAGGPYSLDQSWGFDNIGDPVQYTNRTGTESISMTFTVIPEPSSFAILIVAVGIMCLRLGRNARQSPRGTYV